jgi:TM2 domain-containing membrane protein YozV
MPQDNLPSTGRSFRPLDEATDEQRFLEGELGRIRQTHAPRYNPELAAVLSLLIPGAGQIYLGQRVAGVVMLAASIALISFVIPWIACAIVGCFAAYSSARRLNGHASSF